MSTKLSNSKRKTSSMGLLLQPWARPSERLEDRYGKIGIGAVAAALVSIREPQPRQVDEIVLFLGSTD